MVDVNRVDERDTMFARMARRLGTWQHDDYYTRRPELKKGDDRIRGMTKLLEEGGRHHHPEISREARRIFDSIPAIRVDDGVVALWKEKLERSVRPTETIKQMALDLGAVAVGCTALPRELVYTHKGRRDDSYGKAVTLEHPSMIVFLVEMDFEAMQRAPRAEVIRESARQYQRGAVISRTITEVIRALGRDAESHHDAHYEAILPPLAIQAGLGELGRHNILVSDRFGSRVRIGGVSTDFPLELDAPIDLGVDHFCSLCRKCAENCPSHALSSDEKVQVRGVWKWPTHVERCYAYWRAVGTDCGICMAVCPFSHRNNWFHNMVRRIIRVAPWTHRLAHLADDLVYGRRWK